MYTKILSYFSRQNTRVLVLGALSIATSFAIGIQTAGEVQPITLIEAGSSLVSGDIDGNGHVDEQDVVLILEIAEGYEIPSPAQLLADPNKDGELTVSDALSILAKLSTL